MSSTEPESQPTLEASPLPPSEPGAETEASRLVLPDLPPAPGEGTSDAPTLLDVTEPQLTLIEDTPKPPLRLPRLRFHPPIPIHTVLKWAPWLLGVVGGVLLLTLAVTAQSWGDSSTRIGFTALGITLGAALLIARIRLREQRWVRRRWLSLSTALLVVSLLGIFLAPTIHTAQAHLLERQGNYQRAIEEYKAGGEQGADAEDIGRSYLEWGQANLARQDYQQAVLHLSALADNYDATSAAQQVREPLGKALLGWGEDLLVRQQYKQAIQQFDTLRGQYSDTQAASQLQQNQDEPSAYLLWGQNLQVHQQFQDALTQLEAVQHLFPTSRYAPQAYLAAASDLYDWGQALIQQQSFNDAVARYQQLIAQYGTAPEAAQAQQALSAPQNVTGRLVLASGASDAEVLVRLSSSWTTGPNGYLQGGVVYEATTDANGAFTFTNVSIGTYLVDWQQGDTFTTLLHQGTYNPAYVANVQPLRPSDLGVVQLGS
ncbi:MAG TPA: tetratricopeptide repeat protein [Ktedonobacterales bacterium]